MVIRFLSRRVDGSTTHNTAFKMRIAAGLVAVIPGAVFTGLFSCGAPSWVRPAVLGLSLGVGAAIIFAQWESREQRGAARVARVLFVAVILALSYMLVETAAAPFYPAAPHSLNEWWSAFTLSLRTGPC